MKVHADAPPSTVPITIRPRRPRDIFIRTENCNEAVVLLTIVRQGEESLNRKVEMRRQLLLVPLPSVRVTIWSTLLTENFSLAPLGQWTSIESTVVASPRPK